MERVKSFPKKKKSKNRVGGTDRQHLHTGLYVTARSGLDHTVHPQGVV